MSCGKCEKRSKCKKICPNVEKELNPYGHSIKSVYFVRFVDPLILDEIMVDDFRDHVHGNSEKIDVATKTMLDYIEQMPNVYKKIFSLYYGLFGTEQLRQQKIAPILGFSQNTVSYYIQKGKRLIKRDLKNRMIELFPDLANPVAVVEFDDSEELDEATEH